MADIATTPFLDALKTIFPSPSLTSPESVLAQPWYIVAAVSFSASRKPAAVPVIFEFVLRELEAAQLLTGLRADSDEARTQRLMLASKIREALLHSGLLSGIPRVIESLIALNGVMPEELQTKQVLRDRTKTIADYEKSGEQLFRAMYCETADTVQGLLDRAYPDLGWFCNTVGYGITYGGTDVLTQVEISYAIVAALIAIDAPRQITWHLANAQHGGATLEEAKAVREIAVKVAQAAGVTWSDGVPDVPEVEKY
ncbi:hypothetical protein DAEQUDRAFT_721034 [Daedalea quercina L-15889]|uniref:Carboxymuconolactone decarboxylase-like domain-containing protein n=1 Tax=Daedalea quercina L-15889 TaxID=1314783 RepID=A0A165TYS9_9APHY|nr:hypothetical protein DAEQUDRAFT_721034 [Daedalea quercina L-15889]